MADAQLKLSRAPLPAELASTQGTCPEPVPSAVEGVSRRTLLAAACAAPFVPSAVEGRPLSRHPRNAVAIQSRTAASLGPGLRRDDWVWTRALARFRSAEAALKALEGDPDEDAYGRAHDRFNLAFRRLVAVPAPDLAALADKLEIAAAAELAELTYAPPALAPLARDARRLTARSS